MSKRSSFFSKLSPEQQRRFIRITEIVLGVIGIIAVIYGLAMLLSQGGSVYARVDCPDWNSNASKTEIALYNNNVVELLNDDDPSNDPNPAAVSRIEPNQDKVINDIASAGTYTLAVYTTPVLENGTTFKKPEAKLVEFDGTDNIDVVFPLEKE